MTLVCSKCFERVPRGTNVTKSEDYECEWPTHSKVLFSGLEATQG